MIAFSNFDFHIYRELSKCQITAITAKIILLYLLFFQLYGKFILSITKKIKGDNRQ